MNEKEEEMSLDNLKNFDIDRKYQSLLRESPLLMTALHSACCSQKMSQIEMSTLFAIAKYVFNILTQTPMKPAVGGPRKATLDLKPIHLQTACRLLHSRHPR